MKHTELAAFLGDVAPVLGLRTRPYQRLGGTLRKRLGWRLRELALADLPAYRRYLDTHPEEWQWLDASCRVTISRFGRDSTAFAELAAALLPERVAAALARGDGRLAVHCAGSASGEEPYSLAIAYRLLIEPQHPGLTLDVLGTDVDPLVLERAARATYPWGSLRELPDTFRAEAFEPHGEHWTLRSRFRAGVRFEQRDLRRDVPGGPFDLITCRNVAFTYFDEPLQRQVAAALAQSLVPGGLLMLGKGEALPDGIQQLLPRRPQLYERAVAKPPSAAPGAHEID
jgi:chemotaxis protein methyltransferase CheR